MRSQSLGDFDFEFETRIQIKRELSRSEGDLIEARSVDSTRKNKPGGEFDSYP